MKQVALEVFLKKHRDVFRTIVTVKMELLVTLVIAFTFLNQEYEERVRKFSLLTRGYFKPELYHYIYIVNSFGKHLSELYWILLLCFYILNAQLARGTSNIKSWTGQPSSPSCPYIQEEQERGSRNYENCYKFRCSCLEVLHEKYLSRKFWNVFTKALVVGPCFNKIARPVTVLKWDSIMVAFLEFFQNLQNRHSLTCE